MLERIEGDTSSSATPIDVNGQSVYEKLLARVTNLASRDAVSSSGLPIRRARRRSDGLRPPIERRTSATDSHGRDILWAVANGSHPDRAGQRPDGALCTKWPLFADKERILVDGAVDPNVGLAVDKPVRIGSVRWFGKARGVNIERVEVIRRMNDTYSKIWDRRLMIHHSAAQTRRVREVYYAVRDSGRQVASRRFKATSNRAARLSPCMTSKSPHWSHFDVK